MSTLVFSFSDMWQALKRARHVILWASLSCSSLFFGYALLQPPTFTAAGVFKGGAPGSGNTLTRALELIGGGESYSSSDDPKVFLKCYPVMEEVARSLHLQLEIEEGREWSRMRQIRDTLLAQRAQRLIKKRPPPSSILSVPVTSHLLLEERPAPLHCTELIYSGEMSSICTLFFLTDSEFEIRVNQDLIGTGELGKPFRWRGGEFTLEAGAAMKGKTFNLSFIPLTAAAKSLQKRIQIKRAKEHNSLVEVAFTHRNRHLATSIVNKTMEAFQHYLTDEGHRKISKQLTYLQQRYEENVLSLEKTLEDYKLYLEEKLDAGEMFLFESELEFLAEQQSAARDELDTLAQEMQRIDHALTGRERPLLPTLLAKLRQCRGDERQTMSREAAMTLIQQHERACDLLRVEQIHYDHCLEKLSKSDFDISSLSKVVEDPTLRGHFDKMYALHRNLLDEKNWTSKERALLQEDLATERVFLIKYIEDLKRGVALKITVLEQELRRLQQTLLQLLLDLYEERERYLNALAHKASHFPEKWMIEKRLEFNTKVHGDLIESIIKMIEAKNISYHLDYLSSVPLMSASLPFIPNSPSLVFKFCIGFLLGGSLVALFLIFKEGLQGPSASLVNLQSEGKEALPYRHTLDDLKEIHYYVKKRGTVCAIIGNSPLVQSLCSLFSQGEEKKTILYSSAPLFSIEVRELADQCDQLIVILGEGVRLSDLASLPQKTLFVVESMPQKVASLKELIPYVERLTSWVFWKGGSQQRSQEPPQTESASL